MFAIFEKLKRRRRKSSKRLTVVKDRISKREKTKEARKTCKNNVELTEIKNRVLVYERTRECGRKHFPSESTEIENRIAERGEEAKDTRAYKEKYLTNKNLSIITDDESDSSTGRRTFVGAKSREKRGLEERRSLDEYVIVGVEEKPATPSKKNASDDSDSESVKTRTESGGNCCPKCCNNNNTWYGVLKRKVLRANKISPCVITG
ncbi:hypothetical protein K0M31_017173 [Melipona bicolor]|uniref:Uncharacterized protein n=1 Tax=Melipona bicolor TaxID=60889 RepID=A0AA40G4P4_9HYME|nr:hypothetical protein K0M31_017173 [Melipona bicolor]